jgi:predicted transglutaminase-like cysteine proteinase
MCSINGQVFPPKKRYYLVTTNQEDIMSRNKTDMANSALARYVNGKHPKKDVVYAGRALRRMNGRVKIDVRTMINPNDVIVKNYVKGISNNLDNDTKVWKVQRLVCSTIRYASDKERFNAMEYWQFPHETLHLKTGDCEDGGILMATAMLVLGVPSFRVRVVAGKVKTGQPQAPTGGHAYISYLRESDNNWVPIDWCYLPDPDIPVPEKKIIKGRPEYKQVMFSFNDKYSWAHKEFEVIDIKDIPDA